MSVDVEFRAVIERVPFRSGVRYEVTIEQRPVGREDWRPVPGKADLPLGGIYRSLERAERRARSKMAALRRRQARAATREQVACIEG